MSSWSLNTFCSSANSSCKDSFPRAATLRIPCGSDSSREIEVYGWSLVSIISWKPSLTHKYRLNVFGIMNTKHRGKGERIPFHFIVGVSIHEGLHLERANDFLAQWHFNTRKNQKKLESTVRVLEIIKSMTLMCSQQCFCLFSEQDPRFEFQSTSRRHANRNNYKDLHSTNKANFPSPELWSILECCFSSFDVFKIILSICKVNK